MQPDVFCVPQLRDLTEMNAPCGATAESAGFSLEGPVVSYQSARRPASLIRRQSGTETGVQESETRRTAAEPGQWTA
jgi:hypothetical protein